MSSGAETGTRAQDPAHATAPRFDFAALEFDAVRELLRTRLATSLGRRGVDALVPCASADAARAALGQVAELAARLARADAPPLAGVVDVRSWLERFWAGEHAPTTRDVADLGRLLRATERCRCWLVACDTDVQLCGLGAAFPDVADLGSELEMIVDVRGEVLTSASVKLGEIRREIDAAEAGVRAAVQRFLGDPAVHRCLQSPDVSWRHGRPVFQVRKEHREQIAGVLHDRSQSGATLFIEPSGVVEAANRLSDARAAEHREIQVILAHVCRGLRRCRAEIEAAAAALTELDGLAARARLVHEDGFCCPSIGDGGPLDLRGGRHPILLRRARAEVVPLDVRLGDPHWLLVVTGPNTGGKTVVLKTIGLLSLMALCGVPVPAAAGTQFPFFDGVFADIGDEQAITQNLSTFSSHVTRIVRCLEGATARSLVLLDELGAGTDPEEGGALGYAVLEQLERGRVHAVVTTHLGQLKEFAYRHAGAENGSMAFDGSTLRPLFRLEVGIPGQSHALDIAGKVGMPAEVVQRARERLGVRDVTLEEAVGEVQRTRRRAAQDRDQSARLRAELEARETELQARLAELDRRQLWLQEEADALAEEQLRAARAAITDAVKALKAAPKPFGEQASALYTLVESLLRQTSLHRRRMKFVGSLRRDAVVWVPRLGRPCVVKKIDRTREQCTVEVGNMRLNIAFEDISWLRPAGDRS